LKIKNFEYKNQKRFEQNSLPIESIQNIDLSFAKYLKTLYLCKDELSKYLFFSRRLYYLIRNPFFYQMFFANRNLFLPNIFKNFQMEFKEPSKLKKSKLFKKITSSGQAELIESFTEPNKLALPLIHQNIKAIFDPRLSGQFLKGNSNRGETKCSFQPSPHFNKKIIYDCFGKSEYNPKFETIKELNQYNNFDLKSYSEISSGFGAPQVIAKKNLLTFKEELSPYYNQNDSSLNFESRFESGNLRRVIQMYNE